MSARPTTAMVLAAGLGSRLKPITDTLPKPLVKVGGHALIDHLLDRLIAAGVTRVVVNVHAHADQMEAHLARRRDVEILISDERARLLETGGAVKKARAALGDAPIWVANSDYVWIESGENALDMIARRWNPARMDALVIAIPRTRTQGFETPGDFFADPEYDHTAFGPLTFRGDAPEAPLHCFGVQILDPRPLYAWSEEAFSLKPALWQPAADARRLYGAAPGGFWMQIGDPQALIDAEAKLAAETAAA